MFPFRTVGLLTGIAISREVSPPGRESAEPSLLSLFCRPAFFRLLSVKDPHESPARYIYSPGRFTRLYSMAHMFGQNCSPLFMGGNHRLGAEGNNRWSDLTTDRVGPHSGDRYEPSTRRCRYNRQNPSL